MKKLVTFLSVFLSLSALAQTKIVFKMTDPIESDQMVFADDSVVISFKRLYGEIPYIEVENLTKRRIYIEWENARFNGDRVVFGEESRLSMRDVKADEMVPAGDKSGHHRGFYQEGLVTELGPWNPFSDERILKNGKETARFLIPVRFSNGDTRDYKLRIVAYPYKDPIDYSGIELGMKTSKVKKLIGKADHVYKGKVRDGFFKTKDVETWQYYGSVTLEFVENVLTEINPFNPE